MSRDQVEEIKTKLDITEVVREYVPTLKRSGRNHFGLCPFHNEDTPSFSVNSELGIYKCFGCGESGDVFSFLEKMESVDFPKALEIAAKKAGVTLKREYSPQQKKARKEREKILEANKLAASYYHHILMKHDMGSKARAYVRGRKLAKPELEKFLIGYAPDSFENLKSFMLKRGYKTNDLVKWGLLVEKNNHQYDKFRERLMFPIFDHSGDIVGFSGRMTVKDGYGPKYLNSPETSVYKKSELLYGLYQAKEAIRKKDFVIMVEGNVDILNSHSQGVENIVAPLGTAMTEDQLKLIRRYTSTVYFAFDSDEAGEKALFRALEMAEKLELSAKAIDLGDTQDVDEFIVQGGDWKQLVAEADPVITYIMKRLARRINLNSAEGKDAYARTILKYIAKLGSSIEAAHYLEQLSDRIHVNTEDLRQELKRAQNPEKKQSETVFTKKEKVVITRQDYLLALLMAHTDFTPVFKAMKIETLFDSNYQKLLKYVYAGMKSAKAEKELDADLFNKFQELQLLNVDLFAEEMEFITEVNKITRILETDKIKREIRELKFSDDKNKDQKLKQLIERLSELEK